MLLNVDTQVVCRMRNARIASIQASYINRATLRCQSVYARAFMVTLQAITGSEQGNIPSSRLQFIVSRPLMSSHSGPISHAVTAEPRFDFPQRWQIVDHQNAIIQHRMQTLLWSQLKMKRLPEISHSCMF